MKRRWFRAIRAIALLSAVAATATLSQSAVVTAKPTAPGVGVVNRSTHADFRDVQASPDARLIADWSLAAGDHEGLPFIVVDKRSAKAYVFGADGGLVAWTPALIGMGAGDVFEPGVAEMNMYETKPTQRITPAGRFKAEEWRKPNGEWILWLDYSTQIAIHKLRKTQLALSQAREARLYSTDAGDNRVTYGCVNVPPDFYDGVITPMFNARGGIVYVLPDSQPVEQFFRTLRESRNRA